MQVVFFILFTVFASNAFAQDPLADYRTRFQIQQAVLERQRVDSILKLRQAIIDLRDARQKSCRFKNGPNCYLAELSSIELVLLNIEDDYRLAESRAQIDARRAIYKKIREAADSLRSKVDELAGLIDDAER